MRQRSIEEDGRTNTTEKNIPVVGFVTVKGEPMVTKSPKFGIAVLGFQVAFTSQKPDCAAKNELERKKKKKKEKKKSVENPTQDTR
jgi:hypothetical protein